MASVTDISATLAAEILDAIDLRDKEAERDRTEKERNDDKPELGDPSAHRAAFDLATGAEFTCFNLQTRTANAATKTRIEMN